MSLKLEAGLRL